MKKLIFVLAAVLLLACVFVSCGSKTEYAGILGKWVGEDEGFEVVYVFEKGGKGSSVALGLNLPITYEIDGDTITITADATETMEDMLGMTVQEMLDADMLDDPSSLITVQVLKFELKDDVLILDGDEYKRAD